MNWFDTNEAPEAQAFIGPKYCSFGGRLLYYWAGTKSGSSSMQEGSWGGVPKPPVHGCRWWGGTVRIMTPVTPHREIGTRLLITHRGTYCRLVEGNYESGVARVMCAPERGIHREGDLIRFKNGILKSWFIRADYDGLPGDLPLTLKTPIKAKKCRFYDEHKARPISDPPAKPAKPTSQMRLTFGEH